MPESSLALTSANDGQMNRSEIKNDDHERAAIEMQENFDLEKNSTKNLANGIDEQSVNLPFKNVFFIIIGLCISVFLCSLDQTVISTALPKLASEFNALSLISWVGTAYQITLTLFQPLYGRLSDIFGRRLMFIFAKLIFMSASAVCGTTNSIAVMIAFRAVQGIGGGGVISLALIIIAGNLPIFWLFFLNLWPKVLYTDVIPPRDRVKYQSLIAAAWAVASVAGPFLGGVIADKATWRWIFYVNLLIGALALSMVVSVLHLPPVKGDFKSKIKRIDFIGSFTLSVAVILLLLAFSLGGNNLAWSSPTIIVQLVVGFAAILVFLPVEAKLAVDPIIPLRLFRIRNFSIATFVSLIYGMGFLLYLFYMPVYFQVVLSEDATTSGAQLIPSSVTLVAFSIIGGFFVSKTGRPRIFMWVGFVAMVVGAGMLSTLDQNSSRAEQIGYTIIPSFGLGLNIQNLLLIAQISVPAQDTAVSIGVTLFFRAIGMAIGIALGGTIINNQLASRSSSLPIPLVELKNNMGEIHRLAPELRTQVIFEYVAGIQWCFRTCIILWGIGFLSLLLLEQPQLPKAHYDEPAVHISKIAVFH
ncbi:uncharacterized protein VTP21DRAFT_11084 [Calcarisporiella thermophila]|uniref:uncharacterized protein n=1 Tax=Calcarisporiella thermophila TaxID=911321 RepID=UPI0037446483